MFSPTVKATLEKHSIGFPSGLSSTFISKQFSDASTVTGKRHCPFSYNPDSHFSVLIFVIVMMHHKPKIINLSVWKKILSLQITDLCSTDADEVEIFSLIEEQIPKYKVRADKITNFSGTCNQVSQKMTFRELFTHH